MRKAKASNALLIVVANDFAPEIGGIQRYMTDLSAAMVQLNEQILVIAPAADRSIALDAGLPYEIRRFHCDTKAKRFFNMALAVWRAVAQYPRAEIVTSSWFPAAAIAVFVPRHLRGNVLILVHGKEIAQFGRLRDRVMRWVFSRAHRVAANGTFTRDAMQRRFPSISVDVVGSGVEHKSLAKAPTKSKFVLSVGRLVERKGFDTVLMALPLILQKHNDVRYRLVGAGPDETRLRLLAAKLNVSNAVDFLGTIDDECLRIEYERAYCFAMPCRTIGGDIEGFGLVFLEAAAHGVPSVIGRECGAAEAIGDISIVVDGHKAADVGDAIIRLLDNRDLRFEMGSIVRARVLSDFSWAAVANRVLASLRGPMVKS